MLKLGKSRERWKEEREFTSVELQFILIVMQIVVLCEITFTSPKWTPTMTDRSIRLCNENARNRTLPPTEMINCCQDIAEHVLKRV
jgi:hypothetical protein